MLSRPSFWFTSRLQKSLFSLLPISKDVAILRVYVPAVVLSTRARDVGCGRCCSFEVCIASSTALYKKRIVACSNQLMEMRSGEFFFINLMVRHTTSGSH